MGTPKARSSMPFPSANDLRRSKIVPFPGIGKGTCFEGRATVTWRGHAGGASFAFLHAGEGARQGYGSGSGRSEPARAKTSGGVAPLADLGPRTGDGPTQKLHDSHECAGLLLRSAESLAARLERKHQRTFAAVPAQKI